MRKNLLLLSALAVSAGVTAQTANFTAGNLIVSTVGITITGSGATGPVSLVQFPLTPFAAATETLAFPSSGAGQRFVYPWNSNSGLNLQYNAGFLTLAGFDTDTNVLAVSSSPATSIARSIAVVPLTGAVTYVNNNVTNNGNIPRSAVSDGTNLWLSGAGSPSATAGVQYFDSSAVPVQVSQTPNNTNTRVVSIYNGDLYYSSGGAPQGIFKYTGLPTGPAVAAQIVSAAGASPSPYDFVFTDANTLYVVDDRTQASGGGLLKYTFDGSVWNFAYSLNVGFTTGARGLTFIGNDGSGNAQFAIITNETISGTTQTVPSAIWKVVDGGQFSVTSEKLQDAPTGINFRGIRYIPATGGGNQTLSGTLTLGDTVFGGPYSRNITGTIKQGATTIGTISVNGINASSVAFSGSIANSFTGAATIEWDGSSFLLRKTNITLTGSNLAVGTVSLQNGDVDGSGEVDAADIDEVIANFGSDQDIASDVDVSGEVDAADIDVVIANFGGTDE